MALARCTFRRNVSSDGLHTDEMDVVSLSRRGHDRHVHDRPTRALTEPADLRRGRLRCGGRFLIELTDTDEADVVIGARVEMTFRRLFTADGIANYFWKGRVARDG
jgi:hypothetical protein